MRPEVIAFGQRMEKQLAANTEQKGEDGWKTAPSARPFIQSIREKVADLDGAAQEYEKVLASRRVPRPNIGERQERVFALVADIGNYAMMAADVCGAIPLAQPSPTDISNLRMMTVLRTARAHIASVQNSVIFADYEALELKAFLQEVDDVLSHKPIAMKSVARAILQLLDEGDRNEVINELEEYEPDSPALTDRDDDD
jgi:hypothetical protein